MTTPTMITEANKHRHRHRLSALAREDFAAAARECGTPANMGFVLCGVTGFLARRPHSTTDHYPTDEIAQSALTPKAWPPCG